MIAFTKEIKVASTKITPYGVKTSTVIDDIFIFLLCICPLLQHYKGPIINAGFTVLITLAPLFLLKLLIEPKSCQMQNIGPIIPLVIFVLYKLLAHGFTLEELVYSMLVIFYFVLAGCGLINTERFIKFAYYVAITSCILISIQYVIYYIFGSHLQLVPISLLLPESSRWLDIAQTGSGGVVAGGGIFYRPSAFFLEPSHMYLYLFPLLFIALLKPNENSRQKKLALFLSFGLLLSTSGMGIATVICIWIIYFILYKGDKEKFEFKNVFNKRTFLVILVLLGVFLLLYSFVPFFQQSIDRIFDSSSKTTSAISGRTSRSVGFIKELTGRKFWFGVSDSMEGIPFHMPGLMATLYKYGLIGSFLSYLFYVFCLLKLKMSYFWISFVLIGLSFFTAHTHGTFYMMYYVYILLEGISEQNSLKREKAIPQMTLLKGAGLGK